jgi:hypothetical protein
MNQSVRNLFKRVGAEYGLTVKTSGSKNAKSLIYYRSGRSANNEHTSNNDGALVKALFSMGVDFERVLNDELARAREGRVVSEEGRPLDERDRGYQLLHRLGWSGGSDAVGQTDSTAAPVVIIRGQRKGLGYDGGDS